MLWYTPLNGLIIDSISGHGSDIPLCSIISETHAIENEARATDIFLAILGEDPQKVIDAIAFKNRIVAEHRPLFHGVPEGRCFVLVMKLFVRPAADFPPGWFFAEAATGCRKITWWLEQPSKR